MKITPEGEQFIPLKYHFSLGKGNSIDEYSALVKPFRKLLNDGKPIGKIAFVFYREFGLEFVLGSFAFTNRVIFFPGLTFSKIIQGPNGLDYVSTEINLDHITLERDLTRWHFKPVEKNIRLNTQRTKKFDNNLFLWFVMGISDVTKLEPMPMTQEYLLKAQIGSKQKQIQELERRRQKMLESTSKTIFPVVEPTFTASFRYFINFEIFVSKRKNKELDLPNKVYFIPYPSAKFDVERQDIYSRVHNDFTPHEAVSINIRASKIAGSLTQDAFFYSMS